MKKNFTGYFKLSSEETTAIWESATVVVDTNVLLNLYRFDKQTRDAMIQLLTHFRERLWIPHQVGAEFHRHRIDRIREQQDVLATIDSELGSLKGTVESKLGALRRNPLLNVDTLIAKLSDSFDECRKIVNERERVAKSEYVRPQDDKILEEIGHLYEDSVGPRPEASHLDEWQIEGAKRYEAEIPPGYSDHKKPDARRQFGDYILWRQIIDHCSETGSHLLLITDDTKEDWWLRSRGETISGRPELYQEFSEEVGQKMLMYTSPSFLREAEIRKLVTVDSESVSDAAELLQEQRTPKDSGVAPAHGPDNADWLQIERIYELQQSLGEAYELQHKLQNNLRSSGRSAKVSMAKRLREIHEQEMEALKSASAVVDNEDEVRLHLDRARQASSRRQVFESAFPSTELDAGRVLISNMDGDENALTEVRMRIRDLQREINHCTAQIDSWPNNQSLEPRTI